MCLLPFVWKFSFQLCSRTFVCVRLYVSISQCAFVHLFMTTSFSGLFMPFYPFREPAQIDNNLTILLTPEFQHKDGNLNFFSALWVLHMIKYVNWFVKRNHKNDVKTKFSDKNEVNDKKSKTPCWYVPW